MLGLSLIFVVFQISYFFTAQAVVLDSVPIGVETILLFIYIIFFLFEQFKSQKNLYIYSHPLFWVSMGIMIYLGGSFFFNILANHMEPEQINKYWYFTFLADIIKNVCFSIAVIVYFKNPPIETPNHRTRSVPCLDMV